MEPVPHIVARRTESASFLDGYLARFVGEAGVTRVLVVAGDIPQGIGEFSSALQILEGGFLEKHGIRKVGVAGHPEGHKDVSDPALRDAIVRKNAYADKTGADVQIVTQFVFLPDAGHQVGGGQRRDQPPAVPGRPARPRDAEDAAQVRHRLRRRPVAGGGVEARDKPDEARHRVGAGRADRRAWRSTASSSRRRV